MSLTIRLTGGVLSSNFSEYKVALLAQIRTINTELTTEAHFAQATLDVKKFKTAETTLKNAKSSAIKQVSDIQDLFSAIDEVAQEVRSIRLSLEKQVKARRMQIRKDFVDNGVDSIRKYLQLQSDDFRLLATHEFLDRSIFEDAVSRKYSLHTASKAIDEVTQKIKKSIDSKAAMVRANVIRLDSLPSVYQSLFQDRANLVGLPLSEFDRLLDERIETFEKAKFAIKRDFDNKETNVSSGHEGLGISVIRGRAESTTAVDSRVFKIVINLQGTEKDATDLLHVLQYTHETNPIVTDVHLVEG